jgi:hypothetical protein
MVQYRSPRPSGVELFMTETLPQITALISDYRKWEKQTELKQQEAATLQANKDRTHQLQLDKFKETKRKTEEAEKMSEIKVKTDFTTDILKILDDLPPDAAITGIDAILEDTIYQTTDSDIVNSQRKQLGTIRQGKQAEVTDNVADKGAYDNFVAGEIDYHTAMNTVGQDSKYLDDIEKEDKRRRSVATQELNTLKAYAALGSAAFTHPEQPGVLMPRGQKLIQRIGDALDKIAGGAPVDTPQGKKEITLPAGWKDKKPEEVLNHLLIQMGEKTIELQEDITAPVIDDSTKLEVEKLKDLGDTRSDSLGTLIDSLGKYGVTTEYGTLDSLDIFGTAIDTTKIDTVKKDLKQAILPYNVVSEDVNTITINFNEKDIRMPKKAWVKVKTGKGNIDSKRAYQIVAKNLGISVDAVKELMFGHLKKSK